MSVRDLDDDLRTDVPQLMARLGVDLPRLFEDDGTPTAVIAPLRVPEGTTLPEVLIGGCDFDGALGDAGSLRIAGLRLPKLGYYIADDDPLRSAASVLHGRLPRWPASLEEIARQDEVATLPATSARAMMRRVNCTIREISIAKDVLRAGGTLGVVMIAALQASETLAGAETARDVANMALSDREPVDTCKRLFTAAQDHAVLTGQRCVTLLALLDRHRLATAASATAPSSPGAHQPHRNVGDARRVMDATTRYVCELATQLVG